MSDPSTDDSPPTSRRSCPPSVPAERGGAARVRRVTRQGDADRLDDQAAPRGGAPGRPRRAEPRAPPRDLRDLDHGAGVGAVARPAGRAGPAGPPVRRDRTRRPSAELRIAKAQLVGWLEGLFHGIQATLFAQQMAARQQLEQMQRPSSRPASVRPACPAPRRRASPTRRGPAPTSSWAPRARSAGCPRCRSGGRRRGAAGSCRWRCRGRRSRRCRSGSACRRASAARSRAIRTRCCW